MFKKINNGHLAVLVGIVSIISIAFIQQHVLAQWNDPIGLPGETNGYRLVLNPMTEALQLNGHDVLGDNITIDSDGLDTLSIENDDNTARLCLNGDCRAIWPTATTGGGLWSGEKPGDIYYNSGNVGIGIDASGTNINAKLRVQNTGTEDILQLWDGNWNSKVFTVADSGWVGIGGTPHAGYKLAIDYDGGTLKLNSDLIWAYNKDLELRATGQVYTDNYFGIGTSNPNKDLHIYRNSGNAEIDIQSTWDNTHWGIYQDETTADLRFWNDSNRIVFTNEGDVGIGTMVPAGKLDIEGGEICLNGACISTWLNGAPESYTVDCSVNGVDHECSAGCPADVYVLTDWSCSGDYASCSQNAEDGSCTTDVFNTDCTAVGTCTRYDLLPAAVGPDTYAVNCSINGVDQSCSVGCPAGSYSLTDWSCSGDYASCSQNAEDGSCTTDVFNTDCTAVGTCTRY